MSLNTCAKHISQFFCSLLGNIHFEMFYINNRFTPPGLHACPPFWPMKSSNNFCSCSTTFGGPWSVLKRVHVFLSKVNLGLLLELLVYMNERLLFSKALTLASFVEFPFNSSHNKLCFLKHRSALFSWSPITLLTRALRHCVSVVKLSH